MRASSNDMYTSLDYLNNNPDWGVGDSAWKAKVISGLLQSNHLEPSSLIEVGCGAGAILKCLSGTFTNAVFEGYDISPHAIEKANAIASDRIKFYNADFSKRVGEPADVVLVIDVFEHVDNFYDLLRQVRRAGKNFIFHIPLDLSCRMVLKPHILLQQRTSVGHIHYFTKEMVEWMLKDTGYTIIEWVYTKPVVDMNKAESFKRKLKKILRNLSFSINKDISAKLWGSYSMMILAT